MDCLPDSDAKTGLRTETDLGVFLMAALTNSIGNILLNLAYISKYKGINEYVENYAKCQLPPMDQVTTKRISRRVQCGFLGKFLSMNLLTFIIAYAAIKKGAETYKTYLGIDIQEKDYLYAIILVTFWISNIYVFAAPVHWGTDMMSTCLLRSLAYLFNVWQEEMKSRRITKTTNESLEHILDLGFYLSKLTRSVNGILAPFLFIDMIVLSTSSVMWCYSGFAFFGNFSVLEETIIPLFYCLTSFAFVFLYVHRLWIKCDDAQRLTNAIEAATKELSIDLLANYHLLDKRMKWKSDVLEERLMKEDPIRPYEFFSLKRSAFLPTLASALTYFIIIIQFKLSESNTSTSEVNLNGNFTTNGTLIDI